MLRWHQTISVVFVLGEISEDFWSLRWHPWSCSWVWCQNKVENNRRRSNNQQQPNRRHRRKKVSDYGKKHLSKYQQIKLLCVFIIYSTLFWYWYWWSHLFIFQTFGFLKLVFALFWREPYKNILIIIILNEVEKKTHIPPASLLRKDAGSGLVPSWEEMKSRRWVILIKASRAAAPTPDDETSASTRLLAAEPHFFTLQISAESLFIDGRLFGLLHSVNFDWLGVARSTKRLFDSGRRRFTSSSGEPKPSALVNRRWIEDQDISKIHLRFYGWRGPSQSSCVGESGEN